MFDGTHSLNPLFKILFGFSVYFSQHSIKIWQFHHFSFHWALNKASQITKSTKFPSGLGSRFPSYNTCRYGSKSRVVFFFFWSGWVYKQQQPVAAQLHSDPCRYSLGWATSALSDNTKVRRGISEETGFVEQEYLTWPRVAVSEAVATKVPVSVSSSPSCLSAKKPQRHFARKSKFLLRRKRADNLFWGADCFECSQVINKLKDAGESVRQRKRQILGGFNWNNISHRGVVLFPSATAMLHFMPPCTLPFPTFPLWPVVLKANTVNQ